MCMCVCLPDKSHLTSGASVRPENTVTYSAGNEGQNVCGDFSQTAPLKRYAASCVVGYCSDIPCTFSRQSLPRVLKRLTILPGIRLDVR